MTAEEHYKMLSEVKTQVAVISERVENIDKLLSVKVQHIETRLDEKRDGGRFWIATGISCLAVLVSLGAVLWT